MKARLRSSSGPASPSPTGFPGWKELLREIASELDLDIDEETDLIALAQYHVNQTGGRGGINRRLMEEFT